jgi:hypothetical protein
MRALRPFVPALAALVAGAALYCTQGVIDALELQGAVVRVAFLPGWPAFLASIAAAAMVVATLGWTNRKRRGGDPRHLADLVLPLFASGVLTLPYLPLLPDWLPALQALAGPLAYIVWLVVIGLQFWALRPARALSSPAAQQPAWRLAPLVLAATLVLSGFAAWRLTSSPAFPGGDEPHYLVIAQSIWRDGDLDIQNNHTRGDYYEYVSAELAPHYLTPGLGGVFYSIHPILMPLLMAPIYAAGGYAGVAALLVLISSLAATIAWWWTRRQVGDAGAATFAWVAVVASAPFLLNTFTVYPETFAALAVMTAFVLAVPASSARPSIGRFVLIGMACATLPWFSTKYAPMSATLMLVAFGRLWQGDVRTFVREPRTWAVSVPYALSLVAWFAFFQVHWGNPSPTAPYGDLVQTSPLILLRGAPGLLFDQEYGLLTFAPVYILAGTGLVSMWRLGGERRRLVIEIVLVFSSLLASVGAFALWWGGSASPSRPLMSGLLLLVLPIAVAYRDAPAGSARRAAHYLLLLVGAGIAATLTLAQKGLLLDNGRDGTASLLEYWLPHWPMWSLAPTFTFHAPPLPYLHTLCWAALAALAARALSRRLSSSPGANALAASAMFGAVLVAGAIVMSWLPAGPARPPINLAARSRLAAFDGFDARLRSTAVIYDPIRAVAPSDVLLKLALQVTPSLRADRTAIRLIHNGRFSLPAGEYEVTLGFAGDAPASALGLQVGRLGGPLDQWEVLPRAGQIWHANFHLPVDANFVGFVGSPELERAIGELVITATSLVDASARPATAEVLSARKYRDATLFFHDENLYPEREGLWLRGERVATVTVAPSPGRATPSGVRINSGSRGNTATLSSGGWEATNSLVPGQVAEVVLPAAQRGVIPLTIRATSSYRPRDIDPSSRDSRVLGVWLEPTP